MLPEWKDLMDRLAPIGERIAANLWHKEDPCARQELWRMLSACAAQGYCGALWADPDYPSWVPFLNIGLNIAAPVPDFMYLGSPVHGNGVYRIAGDRGTAHFVDISMGAGNYARDDAPGPSLGSYDLDDLRIGPDRSFNVIMSNERPAGWDGDWWRLDPRTKGLGVRVASYDWLNEIDPRLTIERLDIPALKPRLSAEEIGARLELWTRWVERGVDRWILHVQAQRAKGVVNDVVVHDYASMGGFIGQVYLEGIYDLAPDEALILDTALPRTCRYWSFLLTDDLFATVDWMNRQSSLNGYQARVDADGRFRAVIAMQDPGVPNWLDTGGYGQGLIQGRWNKADSAPQPVLTKVKLGDLRRHLPADTPVVTPAERDAALRVRRQGAQLRRLW
ncbi:MAG: DUF1214 domain-containing protein [Gammaproteobacteria bacterium]